MNTIHIKQSLRTLPIPPHEQFRAQLRMKLCSLSMQPFFEKAAPRLFWLAYILVPAGVALLMFGMFSSREPNESQHTKTLASLVQVHALVAASLEHTFQVLDSTWFRHINIRYEHGRFPTQSYTTDIWAYQQNTRIDRDDLMQKVSLLHSELERKDCVTRISHSSFPQPTTPPSEQCQPFPTQSFFQVPTTDVVPVTALVEEKMSEGASVESGGGEGPAPYAIITVKWTTPEATRESVLYYDYSFEGFGEQHAASLTSAVRRMPAEDKNILYGTDEYVTNQLIDGVFHHQASIVIGTYDYPGWKKDDPWYIQIQNDEQISPVYQLVYPSFEPIISEHQLTTNDARPISEEAVRENHIDETVRFLFDSTWQQAVQQGEPLSQTEETYHGLPALRVQYPAVRKGEGANERDAFYDHVIDEFVVLIEEQSIVEYVAKNTAGQAIFSLTIQERESVNDVSPEMFFTEEYWRNNL